MRRGEFLRDPDRMPEFYLCLCVKLAGDLKIVRMNCDASSACQSAAACFLGHCALFQQARDDHSKIASTPILLADKQQFSMAASTYDVYDHVSCTKSSSLFYYILLYCFHYAHDQLIKNDLFSICKIVLQFSKISSSQRSLE